MSNDVGEPYRRALKALGIPRGKGVSMGKDNEAAFRHLIIEGLHDNPLLVMCGNQD